MNDLLEPIEPEEAQEMVLGTILIELILTQEGTFPRATFDEHMESWQGLGALHFALLQLNSFIEQAMQERRYELHQLQEEETDEPE